MADRNVECGRVVGHAVLLNDCRAEYADGVDADGGDGADAIAGDVGCWQPLQQLWLQPHNEREKTVRI